jgi:hypothetical protein
VKINANITFTVGKSPIVCAISVIFTKIREVTHGRKFAQSVHPGFFQNDGWKELHTSVKNPTAPILSDRPKRDPTPILLPYIEKSSTKIWAACAIF